MKNHPCCFTRTEGQKYDVTIRIFSFSSFPFSRLSLPFSIYNRFGRCSISSWQWVVSVPRRIEFDIISISDQFHYGQVSVFLGLYGLSGIFLVVPVPLHVSFYHRLVCCLFVFRFRLMPVLFTLIYCLFLSWSMVFFFYTFSFSSRRSWCNCGFFVVVLSVSSSPPSR